MSKRGRIGLISLLVAVAAISVGVLAAPSGAASGGGCQLSGTANLSPGLNTTSQSFSYNFSGNLTNCVSSDGKTLTGVVSAGQTFTDSTGSYSEPAATGTGGCAESTTKGIAFVKWSDGTLTIENYTTTGALAGVALTGSVQSSYTFNPGTTSAHTVTTSKYAGSSAGGELIFHPADPTACNTGVTSSPIDGFVELGSQN